MKTTSFAEILNEMLEEEGPEPTPAAARQGLSYEPTPLLQWDRPALKSVNGKAYLKTEAASLQRQAAAKVKTPTPAAKATPAEPVVALTRLATVDRLLVERMIQWGGFELAAGLSAAALKKAHRRLVKQLHPDLGAARAATNNELFLQVQSAFETLRKALPGYLNESACGSESASAEASRRPNAA